jgi:hypothetical protein
MHVKGTGGLEPILEVIPYLLYREIGIYFLKASDLFINLAQNITVET